MFGGKGQAVMADKIICSAGEVLSIRNIPRRFRQLAELWGIDFVATKSKKLPGVGVGGG